MAGQRKEKGKPSNGSASKAKNYPAKDEFKPVPSEQPRPSLDHSYAQSVNTSTATIQHDEPPRTSACDAYHRQEAPPRQFTENYELPQKYDVTAVTLIPRDPSFVHAYWDIASSTMEDMKRKLGDSFDRSMVTLRMYDVTSINFNGTNANKWFDIDLGHDAQNWYVNLWCDNVAYCADLGVRTHDNGFIPMARSNFISTPPAGSSARSDLIWMEIKDDLSKVPFVLVDKRTGKPRLVRKGEDVLDESKMHRRRKRMLLTEDDIRSYYSRLFPLLRKTFRRRGKKLRISDELRRKLRHLFGDDFLLDDVLTGKDGRLRRLLAGASEELFAPEGGSGTVSSWGAGSEQKKHERKFFFELWTELLVYGRTEPDASVYHGGKDVKLNSDGTFSMRFSLPSDTRIPLDFTAVSFDRAEKRIINTEAGRADTKYGG